MSTTVTIRLSSGQRRKLAQKAHVIGKTEADVLQELLDRELADDTVGQRAGHTRGTLSLAAAAGNWRKEIRQRNWRS